LKRRCGGQSDRKEVRTSGGAMEMFERGSVVWKDL